MIQTKDKKDCCGCGACMNACPHKCIDMVPDEEGFLYPFVDATKCVNCNLCEKVCPIINVKPDKPFAQTAYVMQHKDEQVRHESTAGGAFTAIAEWFIQQGGVVFGASYDADFMVEHSYAESLDGLSKFRNSKYVQSNIGDTFQKVKEYLRQGRWVCFSGTPCQAEGLKHILGRNMRNL